MRPRRRRACPPAQVADLRDTDALLDAALRRAQERGGIPEGPRAAVLDQLRHGALLREAAEPTVEGWASAGLRVVTPTKDA